MKQIVLLLFIIFFANNLFAQSDDCSTAITLVPTANCSSPVSGSTAGFTQSASIPACVGTPDDDGWYKFVATATTHYITVTSSASYDPVVQTFSGTCGALSSLQCVDNSLMSGDEILNLTGLTIGNTYFIRIYDYYAGSGSGAFTICLTGPPVAPGNNTCVNAISLPVNSNCIFTAGTSLAATQSIAGCSGNANDDVWYKFVANNYTQDITLNCSSNFDGVVQLLLNNCTTFTSVICQDELSYGGTETINAVGLTIGNTYLIRVYEYNSGAGGTFSICVSGNAATPAQPNDEPCNAIQVPTVTSACNYVTFSNVGATTTTSVPTPSACTGGSGGAGGFAAGTKDVWFKVTVPASGIISVTPKPNQTTGWLTDASMAIYSGGCGSLTQLACSRDYTAFPGFGDDELPFYVTNTATPLPAGSTVYLRFWPESPASTGNFAFCVQSPTNDDCANALYVCNLNGFSGSTSEAYHADRPGTGAGQMYGNNEDAVGTDLADGTNSCGPFGLYPSCPATTAGPYSSIAIDVVINNNSWIKFTASATTSNLKVVVGDCFVGSPAGGLQMQVFSATGCNNFFPVSNFEENSTGFTITAFGLTIGNDYYLMVDGYVKDICNYTIQALDGVAFPSIIATPTAVCTGFTSTLTAPSATSYSWSPGGATTQSIVVTPDKPISTYTCIVTGLCGQKQTLTKSVIMNPLPTVAINNGAAIVNCGTQATILAASGANTYSWSTGNTTTTISVSPPSLTTYSVIGTYTATGCKNTAITTVTVNAKPTFTAAGTNTICSGSSTSLTVTGTASTYTWSPAATLSPSTGTAVTASPISSTNYTITGTGANSCTNSATYSVSVIAKPTVTLAATSNSICTGGTVTLTGSGTATTYTWTGTVTDGAAFTPTSTNTYTVTGTNAVTGCTNQAVKTITVNARPTFTAAGTNTICNGASTNLTVSGTASTYTWSPSATLSPSTGVAVTASPAAGTNYTIIGTSANSCTNSATYSVSVNPKPPVSSSATSNTICNGGSTTLSGTGADTYTWTSPVINGAAFSPTITASYTVTGTNTLTGCTNTAAITVTVNAKPETTVSTTGTITCTTNTINLNSDFVAGATYTWTAPGTSSIAGGTANNEDAIGQGAGTYTLNVLSLAGCTYSATLAANVNMTTPTASATGGTLTCANTSTVLIGGPTSGVTYSWSGPGISGSTTSANATATVVGSYSLITTNIISGCSSTVAAVATVTNNLTTPAVSAGSNQIITCAAPTVTLTGSATAGSSLSWSNGSTTNTTTVGGDGTYALTATNPVTGCFLTSTVLVSPSVGTPTGSVSVASNSITCSLTSASISITSSVSPLTYSWTGPGTIASPTSSATTVSLGGTYTVAITNTASCSQSYYVFVPTNNAAVAASASISATSSITCNTNTVILGSNPQGPEYTYSWSGPSIISGGTTATPVVGTAGNYSVTVTNTITGCINTLGSAGVNVPSNTTAPSLSLSATSLTTTCGAPSTTVSATSNSDPNSTYTWTAPATGTISNISASTPTIGGTGMFTVVVTNTVNGCPSLPKTVNVSADVNVPTYTLSSDSVTINCTTPLPTITMTTSPSGLTYSWSPTPNSGGNTASPTYTAAGNYTCLVTNLANGCSTNMPVVNVELDQVLPVATATPASAITCYSTSITISSTITPASNVTYNWSGPNVLSGSASLSPVIGSGGNYVVAMLNTVNGCVNSYTVIVPSNTNVPSMSLSTNDYTTTCSAPSVIISASSDSDPNSTYTWTAPGSGTIDNINSSTPLLGGSGVFTVAVTNTVNGCVSAIKTVTITPDVNIPTYNLSSNTATITCAIPSPIVSLSSPVIGVTYSWSPTPSSGITTASPTFTATGNYTCVITATNGCSTNTVVAVGEDIIAPGLTVTPSVSITCASNNTVVITSTVNPASTYTWSGAGIQGSANNSSITANVIGDYTLTVTNPINGCTATAVSSVGTNTVPPSLNLVATSMVITCSTTNSTITATPSTTDTPTWVTPSGASTTNSVIATTSGDYIATIVDGINGCSKSQTITITIDVTPPNANAGVAVVMPCNSSSATLSGSSTTSDPVSYSWTGPNAGSITSATNIASPTVNSVGIYTLMVTNLVSGCTETATVNVTSDNVTADFTADPMTGEAPLTVNFTDASLGATSYTWSFGNGGTSTIQNPSTLFNTAGTYSVILIASSTQCKDTISKTIIVEDGFTIIIPNVFTPNGDGANDLFHIKITGVKSAEGLIYNRWGQLLHSWDALNVSWDGNASNGENCPDATYYYLIKVIDKKGKEHIAPGYVLIIR